MTFRANPDPHLELDPGFLYERYGPLVFRRILHLLGSEEAEEVLHEVFLRILENWESFRADASPATWLYRITTNHCLNRIRNSKRRRELLDAHGTDLYPSQARQDPEAQTFMQEIWRELPDDLLEIAVYHHVDGLSHAEIARTLGVSRRTVGNRLEQLARQASAARASNPGPSPQEKPPTPGATKGAPVEER